MKMNMMKKKILVAITTSLLFTGCSTVEILPNLCFDGEETYMCGIMCNEDNSICIDLDNPQLDIEKDLDPIYDEAPMPENCEPDPSNNWVISCEKVA